MNTNSKLDLSSITKMSMPVTTLTSQSETIKISREASFSSYLDGAEKTFILKLGRTAQGLTPSISSTPHDRLLLGKNSPDDKEIDVFDAQKYFNDSPSPNNSPKAITKNILSSHQQLKKDVPTAINEHPPPIAALSIRSDSSWNSRSALLHTAPRSQQQERKANKKKFLASIGCNCSCLTTSIINGRSKQGDKTKKMQLQKREDATAEKRRSHSPIHVNGKKNCFDMDKNLTMVTWDAINPLSVSVAEELKIPAISSEMHNDNDSESDASSDLFEIESLYMDNPFDPTTCYAPSEASIEWSVVTASAADFSLLSDSDEVASTIQKPCIRKSGVNSRTCSFRETPKIRPSILSGCKSHKAVSVAGDAHTRRPLTPMTRFHDESKLSFDAKKSRQSSFDHRVMSQSRSATAAHLLYT